MKGLIEAIEKENLKDSVPAFNVGDTVKVSVKVVEGTRERLQAFEGVVIAKKNGGIRETFTVRRLSYGVGVEQSSAASPCTPPRSRTSRSSARAKCAGRSCITCAAVPVKPQRSKKSAKTDEAGPAGSCGALSLCPQAKFISDFVYTARFLRYNGI